MQFWLYIALCWAICQTVQFQSYNSYISLATTNLVVEDGVPDVFRDSGNSLNIVLAFFVILSIDAIAKNVAVILDQSESTGRESERCQVRVGSVHLLEQLRPSLVFVFVK